MRTVSNRLLPLLARYGSVLLAALLVYYVIREPVSVAIGGLSSSLKLASLSNGEDDIPVVADEDVRVEDPLAPVGVGQDARNSNPQTPIEEPEKYVKKYKPTKEPYPPIEDHFLWLTHSNAPPPVPENNLPPIPHVDELTPLLIGFTRNWPLLLQCVSSYIAAGWPPEDIYVVENTGTFRSNRQHDLSLQNPFFLNHTALHILGVNVIATPTLLSFSQLQNFYLSTALQREWPFFYWSHQDVLVLSDEDVRKNDRDHDWDHDPYATIYERAVGLLRYLNGPDMPPWATHFFAYDSLALVNRDAYLDAGAWDTQIPYYASDCDMYLRLHWAGYWQPQSEAGLIFDVNVALDDVAALFRMPGAHASFKGDPVFVDQQPNQQQSPNAGQDPSQSQERDQEQEHHEAELQREEEMRPWVDGHGETFAHLVEVAGRMHDLKWRDRGVRRNTWQGRQTGGLGEPFHRDPEGFAAGVEALIEAGRRVFADKWGHRGCDLLELGIESKDAWRLERDWDIRESPGSEGGNWGRDWMTGSE
ncbi:hypothetical protein F5B20DRAFT_216674 [Whalleya microplaca]|nr:hypothetical protein F5B20DRAFT_216674 [Whalleya microplaca]